MPAAAGTIAVPALDRSSFPCAAVGFSMSTFKGSVRAGVGVGTGNMESGVALGADGAIWVAGRRIVVAGTSDDPASHAARPWKAGDVIGAAIDCVDGAAMFSVNGAIVGSIGAGALGALKPVGRGDEQAHANSVCLSMAEGDGVIPAVSLDAAATLELNFGEASFRFEPDLPTIGSVHRQVEMLREVRLVKAVGLAAG